MLTAGTDRASANVFEAGLVFNPGGTDRVNALQDEDVLTGTGTNATLNATLGNANDNGGTTINPTLNNIQTINAAFTGAANGPQGQPVTTLDLQDTTGLVNLSVSRISNTLGTAGANFSSINTAGTNNLTISNVAVPTGVNFDYLDDALGGANDSGTLNLRGVSLTQVSIHNAATGATTVGNTQGFENLTLTSNNGSNTLEQLNATQLNSLTITGTSALTLASLTQGAERLTVGPAAINNDGAGNFVLAQINAAGLTNTLTVDLTNHVDAQPSPTASGVVTFLNVVGTAQADTFIINQAVVDSNITVDGGAGVDTLKLYTDMTDNAATANRTTQINNVEKLEVRSQADLDISVDTELVRNLDTILVRNENAGAAAATFRLNNLTAAAADETGAIEVRHATSGNNGIANTVVNAELKNGSGASDLVAFRLGTDLNTQNRSNFTFNVFGEVAATDTQAQARAKAVENVTIIDSDNESNTVRLNETNPDTPGTLQDNNGRGTLKLTGGIADQFFHLDAVLNGYGIATDGSGASTFGLNTNPLNTGDFLNAATRVGAGTQGGLNEGRLKFSTIDAREQLSNVILRVGREATATESGAQSILMGAGNDTVIFDVQNDLTSAISAGLTRDDTVNGGAGNDILGIDGHGRAIKLGQSEWTNVSNFETIRLLGNSDNPLNPVVDPVTGTAYTLVLTNELVDRNSTAAGSNLVRIVNDNDKLNDAGVANAVAANNTDRNAATQTSVTIDATGLSSNRGFIYDGEEGSAGGVVGGVVRVAKAATNDVFIVNDTINGTYQIDGGAVDNVVDNGPTQARNGDVLRVQTSQTGSVTEVTLDDLAGIRNVGTVDFVNLTTGRASVVNTLNDTVVDNMVDSYQTNSTTAPYNETLVVRAFSNPNVANATTVLNLQAGQLTASKAVNVLADRDITTINTGAGADTVVLLGNFANATYANVTNVATGANIGTLGNAVGGIRVLTNADTMINLGAGTDTLVTYGNINIAGLAPANMAGVENVVANSGLVISASQLAALTSLRFETNLGHQLVIVDDIAGANNIDLSKITVSNGSLQFNVVDGLGGGNTFTTVNTVVDQSATGDAFRDAALNQTNVSTQAAPVPPVVITTVNAANSPFTTNGGASLQADQGAADSALRVNLTGSVGPNVNYTGFNANDTLDVGTAVSLVNLNSGGATGFGTMDLGAAQARTVTLTATQHNSTVLFANAADVNDRLVINDLATIVGRNNVANYTVVTGSTFTLGSATQNVSENVTTGSTTVDLNGFVVTGNISMGNGDGNDTLRVTQSASIAGATAGGYDFADFGNTNGVNFTVLSDQNNGLTFANAANAQTVTVANTGLQNFINTRAGIETYVVTPALAGGINIVAGTEGVNLQSANNQNVSVGGLTVTGTYALAGVDTITATNGANIAGVNGGAATTAETLALTGGITMTAAQYGNGSTTGLTTNAVVAGGLSDSISFTNAVTSNDTNAQAVETFNFAAGTNVFTFSGASAKTVVGNTGADTFNFAALTNTFNHTVSLGTDAVTDRVALGNAAIDPGHVNVVTVNNFTVANDAIASLLGGASLTAGGFVSVVNGSNTDLGAGAANRVIEITNSNVVDLTADGDMAAIENILISSIGTLANGSYTAVVYSGANAGVYQFSFTDAGTAGVDAAMELVVEHLATIVGVGLNALDVANFY